MLRTFKEGKRGGGWRAGGGAERGVPGGGGVRHSLAYSPANTASPVRYFSGQRVLFFCVEAALVSVSELMVALIALVEGVINSPAV